MVASARLRPCFTPRSPIRSSMAQDVRPGQARHRARAIGRHQIAPQALGDALPVFQPGLSRRVDILVDHGRHGVRLLRRPLHPGVLAALGSLDGAFAARCAGVAEVERVGVAEGDLDRLVGDAGAYGEDAPAARLHHQVEPRLLSVGDLQPPLRVGLDPGNGRGGEQLRSHPLPLRVTCTGNKMACSAMFRKVQPRRSTMTDQCR